MACTACGRDFHSECDTDCKSCHGDIDQKVTAFISSNSGAGRPKLDDSEVTDTYSTGRKRAAIEYPLNKQAPCEWRGLKNCGGGVPIVGCINGFQQDRHHGPVKNPLRNEKGNVHRICKKCHKRWHTFNDMVYSEQMWDDTNHEPEPATESELKSFELKWLRTSRSHVTVDTED